MDKKIHLYIIFAIFAILVSFSIFLRPVKLKKLIISDDEYYKIISDRKENSNLLVSDLKFDNIDLIYDSTTENYYYSIIDGTDDLSNIKVSFSLDDYKSEIKFLNFDFNSIIDNIPMKILIYNDYEYNIFDVYCSTLPFMNIVFDDEISDQNLNMNFYLYDNRENALQKVISSSGFIHLRGGSSLFYPKNSFRISLNSAVSDGIINNNISLLGMRRDDDWILYSIYSDQEKVRNVFSSNLWYESCSKNNIFNVTNGMEYKYIELFLNGEYWGLYALGFPIDDKQENIRTDVSGVPDGYIFKKNNWQYEFDENGEFVAWPYKFMSKIYSSDSYNILANYYINMFNSNDIDTLYSISDINTAIDIYLFYNFSQGLDNIVGGVKNTYITFKKIDDKYVALYAPWDLDITFGNSWVQDSKNFISEYGISADYNILMKISPVYFLQELGDTNINKMIIDRYYELRKGYWSDEYILSMLDEYEQDIYDSGAFLRDMERWPDGNYNLSNEKLTIFKSYVIERLKYMDEFVETLKSI